MSKSPAAAAVSESTDTVSATMAASALSGMLARIPLHPIDTCKAKLQVSLPSLHTPVYRNFIDCAIKTYSTEGLRGLYQGFPIAFFGSAPAACLYFTSYELNKKLLSSNIPILANNPFSMHFTAGLLAECLSCVLWVPIDVVKERLQVQSNMKYAVNAANIANKSINHSNPIYYKGTIDAILTIARTEGFRGIYKGYGATVASFGPYSALYLSLYEQFKSIATELTNSSNSNNLPFYCYLVSGGLAGGLSAFITNPLDLAKLRIQVQRGGRNNGNNTFNFGYRNLLHGMQTIIRTEGLSALFKGAGARIAFYLPSSAITIAMFDTLKSYINKMQSK